MGPNGSGGDGCTAETNGSCRDQKADDLDAGFDNQIGGLMAGADTVVGDDWRGGLFIGAAASCMETTPNFQTISAGDYFAGGYASFAGPSTFVGLSLTAGVSDFSSDRHVAINLTLGGIEHAVADYRGFFISLSVTLGTDCSMENGGLFTPSLRAAMPPLKKQPSWLSTMSVVPLAGITPIT